MIILIIFVGLLLRLLSLNQSLWLDEAAQVIESSRSWGNQLNIDGDFWPPLYHILLHLWLGLGKSEIWLRSLSVVIAMFSLLVSYKLARLFTTKKKSLMLLLLLVVTPYHIWYSQEIRPYMLSVLLGLTSTYFLVRKSYKLYISAGILFVYTTYLAPFLLAGQLVYVCLFEKKWIRKAFGAILIIYVFFLPWLGEFTKQLTIGRGLTQSFPGWSDAVSVPLNKVLPLTFTKFMLGRISFANKLWYGSIVFLLACMYGYFLINALRLHFRNACALGILIGVPIISTFLFSFFLPIFAPQRLIFLLPLFYILFVLGIIPTNRVHIIAYVILIAISGYSIWLYNTKPQFQREQWREAVKFVETNKSTGSTAIFVFPQAFAPWQWYSRNLVTVLAVAPTFTVKPQELSTYTYTLTSSPKLFLFHYLTDITDPSHIFETYLENLGFRETNIHDFSGVGFISTYEKVVALR